MLLQRLVDNIQMIFGQMRFHDLLDMVFVWLIVYRVLLLIRQTRAIQMLSGLGILAIVFIMSIWADLATMNWLLDKFFNNLFVIVVILFQNEFRKALAHIGRNPFFASVSALEETHVIEEIVKGSIQLAQKGYGALIVIEREIGLEDFLEEGTKLDAQVSSDILNSIFLPASPLHDGAVIIRGGRLNAGGCFLPLSRNPNLDKRLGTRHRAAIGLTEETDAVVVVVSEEFGQVGIALGGQLMMDLDMPSLRRKLYDLFSLQEGYRNEREMSV